MLSASAILGLCLGATGAKGQIAAEWLNPVSGDWEAPTLWSIDPVFPDNGTPGVSDTYDVRIGALGSPYRVLVDGSHPVVNSLLIDSIDATVTIESGRRFTAVNGLTINAGVFQLAAGQLHNTTVTGDGLVEVLRPEFGNQTAEFVNVILGTDMAIQTNNNLEVTGGLHLLGPV